MEPIITWGLVAVAGAAALYGLHRLALWLEREGWIRYLNARPDSGASTGALLFELQRIYEPQTQHVFELKESKKSRSEAAEKDGR